MKYFVFTYAGLGLPVALHLKQEGLPVTVGYVENRADVISEIEGDEAEDPISKTTRLHLYDGLIEKLPAQELIERIKRDPHPENCFVFFDDNNLFRFAHQLRHLPIHGNFPTEQDHLFEIDRNLAKEFADQHYNKLLVAEKKDFSTAAEGVDFLHSSDELWVLKGKAEEARTIIPESSDPELANAQLIEALTMRPEMYEEAGFILELMISPIIELTPEKMYYDGQPVATTLDIENKPLGSGNLSVQTGCASDMVFETDLTDRINQIAFPPIVDQMAKEHKGLFIWDASILIDSRTGKMYFGEYCSNRPGYNSLFTEIAIAGSTSRFFEALIKGKTPYRPGQVGVSVRLFNLHHDDHGRSLANAQFNYKEGIEPHLWLWDLYQDKHRLKTVGSDRNLAVVTAAGQSVDEAINRLYRTVDSVAFEGVYYRPKFDYISREYPTAILNRLNYGLTRNLYKIGFAAA